MKNNNAIIKSVLVGVSFSLTLLTSSVGYAKEYYKWVDSKGTTHYTTTPPPKTAKRHGKIDTYGYRSDSPAPTQAQNTTQNTAPVANTNVGAPNNTLPAHTTMMDNQQREANAALQNGSVERAQLR